MSERSVGLLLIRMIPRLASLIIAAALLCVAVTAQPATPTWTPTGSLHTPRYGQTATLLPNDKVLVTGGVGPNCTSTIEELFDPASGTWSLSQSLNQVSYGHTATLLQNGQVLVTDDVAQLYDPASNTWRLTGSLNTIRSSASAVLLQNGKVLVIGDSSPGVSSAELYEPITGTWSTTTAPSFVPGPRHTVLLPNGKVLAVAEGSPWDYDVLRMELYDSATGQWTSAGYANLFWVVTVTVMRNGKVLVTGLGINNPTEAAVYDSETGTWSSAGSLSTYRHYGGYTATLLANGQVLVAGGIDYRSNQPVAVEEIYDPARGSWRSLNHLIASRSFHSATLLRNGKVLMSGGSDGLHNCGLSLHSSAELYNSDSATNSIDNAAFFVQQHYLDFLNRDPDPAGFAGWQAVLNNCVAGDTSCDRIHVSAAFFQSPEFQERGYFAYRQYSVAFGRKPDFSEFIPDLQMLSGFLSTQQLELAKRSLTEDFVYRPAFLDRYGALSNTAYVDTLLSTAGVTLPNRQELIDALGFRTKTRARVFREILESAPVYQKYYNQAFVVMQYFGYLRRDPDALYLDWIRELDATGDVRTMVSGFVNSIEYRARFQ